MGRSACPFFCEAGDSGWELSPADVCSQVPDGVAVGVHDGRYDSSSSRRREAAVADSSGVCVKPDHLTSIVYSKRHCPAFAARRDSNEPLPPVARTKPPGTLRRMKKPASFAAPLNRQGAHGVGLSQPVVLEGAVGLRTNARMMPRRR